MQHGRRSCVPTRTSGRLHAALPDLGVACPIRPGSVALMGAAVWDPRSATATLRLTSTAGRGALLTTAGHLVTSETNDRPCPTRAQRVAPPPVATARGSGVRLPWFRTETPFSEPKRTLEQPRAATWLENGKRDQLGDGAPKHICVHGAGVRRLRRSRGPGPPRGGPGDASSSIDPAPTRTTRPPGENAALPCSVRRLSSPSEDGRSAVGDGECGVHRCRREGGGVG